MSEHEPACSSTVYAEQNVDELAARSLAETDRDNRYVRTYPEQYRWSFFSDPDEHQRSRRAAGFCFAADLRAHPERYVPGRLPHLPFADASFDLVLSSHLLFSYADRLDFPTHCDMIRELIRVTHSELRIFPLAAMGHTEPYPMLDALRAQLAELRVSSRVVDVDYEFQADCKQMLLCHHADSPVPTR